MSEAGNDADLIEITPGDGRYPALSRGFNQRWTGAHPDRVVIARDSGDVVRALEDEIPRIKKEQAGGATRKRVTVRSGGHCYEDFVCSPDVTTIIDVSAMCGMHYDYGMGAYCVESGATNWHTHSLLYPATGLALPGGSCYSVGLGGHITGGGFGLMSRQQGLTVDYLYAVEVAVVTADYKVKLVTATKDDKDTKSKALWWAHTGGGGGNFGVVTRFWFKDAPKAPSEVLMCGVAWDWPQTKEAFAKVLKTYGEYFKNHQDPATPEGRLFAMLKINHRVNGQIGILAQLDAEADKTAAEQAKAAAAMQQFIDAMDACFPTPPTVMLSGMGEHPAQPTHTPRRLPWLTATQSINDSGPNRSGKYKSAYIRDVFSDAQVNAMWDYLGNGHFPPSSYTNKDSLIQIDSYGSAINTTARKYPATAVPQRDSILKMQFQTYWLPEQTELGNESVRWIKETFAAIFSATHGVPATSSDSHPLNTDGCYINYPDGDLPGPSQATTGAETWPTLYYKGAYPALQKVKADYDPHDVFRHAQSIRLPD